MQKVNLKRKLASHPNWHFALDTFLVIFGAIIGGFAFKSFYEPASIIASGLSGLAQIISLLLARANIHIAVSIVYLFINIILFFFSLKLFGWKFVFLSTVGTAAFTLSMQFAYIPISGSSDKFLFAVFGAVIAGIGTGIAFLAGGSTGGSDIAALIINKFFPRMKTGTCMLIIHFCVITLSIIVSGLQTGLYAIVVAFVSSFVLNGIMNGRRTAKAYYIICDKDEEIAAAILKRFNRGVTKLKAQGMFSKKDKTMLLCLVAAEQGQEMRDLVKEIDRNAFVFSTTVNEALGDGFFMMEASAFKKKVARASNILKAEKPFLRAKIRKNMRKRYCLSKIDK